MSDETVEVRRAGGPKFGMVYASVMCRPGVSMQAKAVYALLTTYANSDRVARPSIDRLAAEMDAPRRTFQRALYELRDKGIVRVELRREAHKASIYHLLDYDEGASATSGAGSPIPPTPIASATSGASRRATGGTRASATSGAKKQTSNEQTSEQTKDKDSDAAGASSPAVLDLPGLPEPEAKSEPVKRTLATEWWDQQDRKPVGANAFVAAMASIQSVLDAGHDVEAVRAALAQCRPPLSNRSIEFVLNRSLSPVIHVPTWTKETPDGWKKENHG